MAVDETSLERIRKATFPATRRGYDKREVEKFLNRLADWLETGGGDQARSDTVRRELERVGERTGSILAEAEESAQQIRAEAEQEAHELLGGARSEADQARKEAESYAAEARAAADTYAKETRSEADSYSEDLRRATEQQSRQVRANAEQDGHEMVEAGQAQARRTVEEGIKRRKDIESVITDLTRHRDNVIAEMESLGAMLVGTAAEHKPAGGRDRFATPSKLDPLDRKVSEQPPAPGEDTEADDAREPDEAENAGEAAATEAAAKDGPKGQAKGDGKAEAKDGANGAEDGAKSTRSSRRKARAVSKSKG